MTTATSQRPSDGIQLYAGVVVGSGADLQAPCIVGKPPRGRSAGELPLTIGRDAVVRPFTTIYAGCVVGDRFQTGQCVSIREDNTFGDDVSIGTCVRMECGNRVATECASTRARPWST